MTVLHRSTNGRAGVARSNGMNLVKGSYVLFADADDIMQPDMCETLYGLALKHDADIVACSWSISDQKGHLIGRGYLPDRQYDLASARQRAKAYRLMNYSLWNKIFRHEVIVPLRFEQFEANIGEDTLFNVAALCRSRTMVTTAYVGYDYIVHTASATGRSSRGMPYLRTLALSGDRIRQTVAAADKSAVGENFSDRIAPEGIYHRMRLDSRPPGPKGKGCYVGILASSLARTTATYLRIMRTSCWRGTDWWPLYGMRQPCTA